MQVLQLLDSVNCLDTPEQIQTSLPFVLQHESLPDLLNLLEFVRHAECLALFNQPTTIFSEELYQALSILEKRVLLKSRYVETILRHSDPWGAARCLDELEFSGLLIENSADTERNFGLVDASTDPWHFADILIAIQPHGLLQEPTIAQANVNAIANCSTSLYQLLSQLETDASLTQMQFDAIVNPPHDDESFLSEMAQDNESAIRMLTPDEERRLEKLHAHYQPKINSLGGVDSCFDLLLEAIIMRYESNPAQIEVKKENGNVERLSLPLEWEMFEAQALLPQEQARALKCYYQHTAHTVYRYLMFLDTFNPWASLDADPESHELFKPLIVLLWLAASDLDEKMAPTEEGCTVVGRQDQFFKALALIQRTHNWDKERPRIDVMTGEALLDDDGKPLMEEYDDEEGDKRTCLIGVRAQLFQAVHAHPLLDTLSRQVIHIALRSFARQFFKEKITDDNRNALREAWKILCERPSEEEVKNSEGILAQLNIPETEQAKFLNMLTRQHDNFQNDLRQYAIDLFRLNDTFSSHVERFGDASFAQLVRSPRSKQSRLNFLAESTSGADATTVIEGVVTQLDALNPALEI
jgi:DNA-binding phage protein